MTIARKQQISLKDTPYYHIYSRCVRRAFLCGFDKQSKKSFEHRRKWIVDRINYLSSVFYIDICAYAIMENHYHLVLKVGDTKDWSDLQVLTTWRSLCKLNLMCEKFLSNEPLSDSEMNLVNESIKEYRSRLMSISWFMKLLNQNIAKRANEEDEVTGHFWESRFKSQALLDDNAVLTAMVYVDLNPIRAAMAKTPETSDFTSIQQRIKNNSSHLLALDGDNIPFKSNDYLQLTDATGRVIIDEKPGYIPNDLVDILTRLNINSDTWLTELNRFQSKRNFAIGAITKLRKYCSNMNKKFTTGLKLNLQLE